jgi:NAD(P)-dependent dehydrogenase (short-subunit alcohol dehydrogenase family)
VTGEENMTMSGLAELRGKVAVVTGGASGIGAGIARQFAAEGMRVVIADVEADALRQASESIGALGIRTDVRDPASVQALADATMERYGTVHVVVKNAGIGPMAKIADLELSDWRWMVEVNLWGVIHGVHSFLPLLLKNPDGGHIVNTASVGGLTPAPGLGPYCVTKFGVVALTETLAQELAMDGSAVGASVLCPGLVRTKIARSSRNRPAGLGGGNLADVDLETMPDAPSGRWLEPDDVGRIVVAGIRSGDLYIITHPEMWPTVQPRHKAIESAFASAAVMTTDRSATRHS